MNGTELGDKLIEKYELGKEHGRIGEYHRIMGILFILEQKILKEDKVGCTSDMFIEGTFSRIKDAIYDIDTKEV